jgi:hypothetical protein
MSRSRGGASPRRRKPPTALYTGQKAAIWVCDGCLDSRKLPKTRSQTTFRSLTLLEALNRSDWSGIRSRLLAALRARYHLTASRRRFLH